MHVRYSLLNVVYLLLGFWLLYSGFTKETLRKYYGFTNELQCFEGVVQGNECYEGFSKGLLREQEGILNGLPREC